MTKPIIVFDLDGTIADTAPDLIGTLNRIVTPFGLEPLPVSRFGEVIGQGAIAMIERTFALNSKPLDTETRDQLFGAFIEDYSANIAINTRTYDGLLESMETLEKSGFIFAVCTNKKADLASILLDELGIHQKFASLTGGDTFEFKKPDGRHITETIKLAGGDTDGAIMIGDSSNDILAAKDAGIASIAVTFGYSDVPIEKLGADRTMSDFKQLVGFVEELTKR